MERIYLVLAGGLALVASGCATSVQGTGQGPAQSVAGARVENVAGASQEVTLTGNVHPMARAEFDAGPVDADSRMDRMLLLLKPSAAQQAELDALVEAQQDRSSALYHHWLTPAEYGVRFGASANDIARVTAWLMTHGFTVEEISAGKRLVIFSGTVGQVWDAFHTEMRRYRVQGVANVANAGTRKFPLHLAAW